MLEKPRDKRIATNYRVVEPIDNFRLRVKIMQQRPLLAELLENEGDTRDSNFLEEEDRIFSWQEKVFSPFEINFYGDEKNCLTEHQQQYHRDIKERNVQGSQLYTYTHVDSYYLDDELLTKRYKTTLSIRNQTALPALQNRKPFSERYNKLVIEKHPTEARIRTNHYCYMECTTMHVMVDLSPKSETSVVSNEDLETVLCTITYDKLHKILTINPDFTNDLHYSVVNSSGIKFNYWIEHASQKPSMQEMQWQQNELRREIKQRNLYKEAEISAGLQAVPPNTRKVFIKLTIAAAHNFYFDGLFVTYYVDLSGNWSTSQKETLCGRTQRCNLKEKSAYFSYMVDIPLDYKLVSSDTTDKSQRNSPCLLFSVASLDNWTRYRIEGYGALALPLSSGLYEFNVPTWRPVGSFVNSLRRFFTGGTYQLEDITHCAIPFEHDASVLNKANMNVVPSGYIKLNVNIINQSYIRGENILQLSTKMNADALMNNVESIFEQFKIARERMIQARNFNL